MAVDLVFDGLPITGSPVNLVFGEDLPPVVEDATVSFVTSLPKLSGAITVRIAKSVSFVSSLPRLSGSVGITYLSGTSRPTVGLTRASFEDANGVQTSHVGAWEDGASLRAGASTAWQDAARLQDGASFTWVDSDRSARRSAVGRYEDARNLGRSSYKGYFEEASRAARHERRGVYEDALRLERHGVASPFQDTLRESRNWAAVHFEDAIPYSVGLTDRFGIGQDLTYWFHTRYEDAMRPPPGRSWYPPEPPEPEACYEPSPDLVFSVAMSADRDLVFVCDYAPGPDPEPGATVVVPIRGVYLVINSAVLIRVSDSQPIPTLGMSMSLDVDSWTWSFSARVPGVALPLLVPDEDGPVHVQATINGVAYRFIVEGLQRDRSFNSNTLTVRGRGRLALLDSPYAPIQDFMNTEARTAQQLIADVLTDNGVPLGWDVTWGLTDWLVPTGVFSHQGSRVSAMNTIAAAAGAYVQPHRTDEALSILLRYPEKPWEWGTVTPDYELPSAVTVVESMEWQEKPRYNRVYVQGQQVGVNGRVTRGGTAGDLLAPAVVDALITHADAARQRGTAILSDTGRIASVSLRLPVLTETGIIPPGKFVRYTDPVEGNRIGISRSVSVDVGLPTVWQTIQLETHEP